MRTQGEELGNNIRINIMISQGVKLLSSFATMPEFNLRAITGAFNSIAAAVTVLVKQMGMKKR